MKLEVISRKAESKAFPLPVLFVHGGWHGAWCWEEYFLPYFAANGFDCYAFSFRGHGKSECDKRFNFVSIDDYVKDLASVVEQIGAKPVLIGHSMGGVVVQRYLAPYAAPAAVLLSSIPPSGALKFVVRTARRRPLVFLKYLVTQNPYVAVATPELTREMFFSSDIPPEKLNKYYALMGSESAYAAINVMGPRLLKAVRVGGTPVLVLGAANDLTIQLDEVKETASAYGCEAEVFPGMAHDMMLEEGWQDVADRIITWLRDEVTFSESVEQPFTARLDTVMPESINSIPRQELGQW